MSGVPTATSKARNRLGAKPVARAFKMRLGGESREVKLVWAWLANAAHLGDSILVRGDGSPRSHDEVVAAAARHDLVVGMLNVTGLTESDLREIVADVAEWRE